MAQQEIGYQLSRLESKGFPRFMFSLKALTPWFAQNYVLERKLNKRFDHGRFGLMPKHHVLAAHVTINDELPNRIISGTVVVS
ncbi:hypothetical protein ANCDUO_26040 [Ancylostoma duodenale]|uniref:Flavin-containing monooxygenase n=1 Tax=Ancylostoma duodenale TaxID=51022 RepID=A0A0C2C2Y6_9BILA|nr:hypothetical protein ANCDUO_26040 [Ancylostoma duodenale]